MQQGLSKATEDALHVEEALHVVIAIVKRSTGNSTRILPIGAPAL